MNIYPFINSRDIREHLKKIGYTFSSLEAAWLVYQCRTASLAEKHAAWQEIIDTMPDCKIEKRLNTQPRESLHTFLQEYMALQNTYIEELYRTDGHTVYQYRCVYNDSDDWCDGEAVFSSFDACCNAIENEEEDIRTMKEIKGGQNMSVNEIVSTRLYERANILPTANKYHFEKHRKNKKNIDVACQSKSFSVKQAMIKQSKGKIGVAGYA